MAVARADKDEAGPERTCIVTRQSGPPDRLIRFVRGPDGAVVPDLKRKLPGRGVWVTGTAKLVAEAARKGGFARGFKAPVIVSPKLAEEVGELLERDALQSLSLANKAGAATSGFSKTEAALRSHAAAVLLEASDAAVDGRGKLERIYARTAGGGGVLAGLFDSAQLGLALGRPHVIHAALVRGAATDAFVARCRKLAQFRGVDLNGTTREEKE